MPTQDSLTRFLELLREEEATVLLTKTSWGRNELVVALGNAKVTALARYNDELRARHAEAAKH